MQMGSNWNGAVLLPPPEHPAEFVQAFYMPGALQRLWGAQLLREEDL